MSSLSGDHLTKAELLEQNEELRRRLEEAEQTLEAIRSGNVDALVVADTHGEQIYTLTGAEHVYRVIVETMNEAAVTVDTGGTVLFCNQRFCDLMKTPMQETLGRRITSFAARPQQQPLKRLMADAQAGPVQRHITLRAVDGTAVPVQLSASLLHANGATSICLVASDLTELEASANSIRVLREHQQALEESESRFRTIFESSQDAIVITDDEGTYIQANPAVETIFGLSSEHLLGRGVWDFVNDTVEFSAIWQDFRATGSFRGEMSITDADGQVRYVDAYAVANILPGRHLCVVRDITERKRAQEALEELNAQLQVQTEELQAQTEELNIQTEELRIANEELQQTEQALRESRHRLETIVDSIADGFYALDRHWRFTHVNDVALTYFHKTREEVLGRTLLEVFPAVVGSDFEIEFRRAMSSGEPVHVEAPSVITDRMVEIYAYPGPENLTVLFRDATERMRMEQALRESEERFHRLFEDDLTGDFISTPEGQILLCNPAFARIFGFSSAQEAIGTLMLDLYIDTAERELLVETLKRQGKIERLEVWRKRRDGEPIYVVENLVGHVNGRGELYEIKGYVFDDTERKRAEQSLRESEKRLGADLAAMTRLHNVGTLFVQEGNLERVLGEIVDAAMAISGADFGNIQLLDPGSSSLRIVAQRGFPTWWLDFWTSVPPGQGACGTALQRGERVIVEDVEQSPIFAGTPGLEIQRKAGVRAIQSTPLVSRSGRPLGMFSTHYKTPHRPEERVLRVLDLLARQASDIIERAQYEEGLRDSEARLRLALDAGRMGTWVWDLATDTVDADALHHRLWDLDDADVRVPASVILQRIHPEDRGSAFDRESAEHRLTGPLDVEFRILRRDGSVRWLSGSAVPVRDADGVLRKVIGVNFDITDRKRAEESLRGFTKTLETKVAERTAELELRARQLQKLALELSQAEDRERRRLAEILHDDLQQQLAAAKFHVGILAGRARADLAVQQSALQIDKMLRDAVETSRSLSHELSPAVMYHGDLGEILEWLANQIRVKHGLIVHVDTYGEIDTQSDALKTFLFKAVQEMLFNAVKHARVGEARVRVRRMGRYICLSVSDRGRGFDPQELKQTAGFGLMSIRERIGLLGGRMRIHSIRGEGSRFIITVPDGELATDSELALAARPVAKAGMNGTVADEAQLERTIRVLIADDHEIVRQGLASLLDEAKDVEVVGEAANGREAVDMTYQLRPDVVIMDVAMPLMSGEEATKQIRKHLPQTRIVALSMYDETGMIDRMHRAGAESYVLKTAPAEELFTAVRGTR